MGGKQKKKLKGGKKEPSIFDKPMENPFLDFVVKEKVPVKTKNGKDLFDKPMENPFTQEGEELPAKKSKSKSKLMESPYTQEEEKPPAEDSKSKSKLMESPYTQIERVPKRAGSTAIRIPKRKSREEVSATRGWTHAVKQLPRKKTS